MTQVAQVASHRVQRGQGDGVVGTEDTTAIAQGLPVLVQGVLVAAQPTVVGGDVVADIERPVVIGAEDPLEPGQQAEVKIQRLGELAPAAQVGPVGVSAQQGDLVVLAVALPSTRSVLRMRSRASAAWASDRMAIATSTAMVSTSRSSGPSRSRHTLQGLLPEPGRLGMAAAQVQPSHLVDDEAAQRRIAGLQEAAIGLEVLQRQVVDRVVGGPVGVTRVRLGQQGIRGRPVRQERLVPAAAAAGPASPPGPPGASGSGHGPRPP